MAWYVVLKVTNHPVRLFGPMPEKLADKLSGQVHDRRLGSVSVMEPEPGVTLQQLLEYSDEEILE